MSNKQLKIMSYNIWFNAYRIDVRLKSLYVHIKMYDPDVVCLQEVLSEQYENIKSNLKYQYCWPDKINQTYGCVILSKYPLINTAISILPTNMGRQLILGSIAVNDKKIMIANIHFESEFQTNNNIKNEQYKMVGYILNQLYAQYNNIILCADTNAIKYDYDIFDNSFSEMKDCWIESGGDHEKEYTYDGATNKNIMKNKNLKSRMDRILFRSDDTLHVTKFYLIVGMPNQIQPSDHHGIMTCFDIM